MESKKEQCYFSHQKLLKTRQVSRCEMGVNSSITLVCSFQNQLALDIFSTYCLTLVNNSQHFYGKINKAIYTRNMHLIKKARQWIPENCTWLKWLTVQTRNTKQPNHTISQELRGKKLKGSNWFRCNLTLPWLRIFLHSPIHMRRKNKKLRKTPFQAFELHNTFFF